MCYNGLPYRVFPFYDVLTARARLISLHPSLKKRHMTRRVGSVELAGRNSNSHQNRTTWNNPVFLDVFLQKRPRVSFLSPPWSLSCKSAAVMYLKVVFFAVALSLISAAVTADSGKFLRPLTAQLAANCCPGVVVGPSACVASRDVCPLFNQFDSYPHFCEFL